MPEGATAKIRGGLVGEAERSDRLRSVYGARDSRELAGLYDVWAEDYERDVLAFGYTIPAVAAGMFCRHVEPGDGAVLDAGAGTGMMGTILAPLGYTDLTGIDLSPGMLKLASEKGVYSDLRRMELGRRLDFPDDAFAATVATGVFTEGHAPPEALEELVRVTAPGGHVVFSVREDVYRSLGFEEQHETLEGDGRWRLVEKTGDFAQLPLEDPDLRSRVYACRVN